MFRSNSIPFFWLTIFKISCISIRCHCGLQDLRSVLYLVTENFTRPIKSSFYLKNLHWMSQGSYSTTNTFSFRIFVITLWWNAVALVAQYGTGSPVLTATHNPFTKIRFWERMEQILVRPGAQFQISPYIPLTLSLLIPLSSSTPAPPQEMQFMFGALFVGNPRPIPLNGLSTFSFLFLPRWTRPSKYKSR